MPSNLHRNHGVKRTGRRSIDKETLMTYYFGVDMAEGTGGWEELTGVQRRYDLIAVPVSPTLQLCTGERRSRRLRRSVFPRGEKFMDKSNLITLQMSQELMLHSDQREVHIPRGSGPKQIAAMIKELAQELRAEGKDNVMFEQDPDLKWRKSFHLDGDDVAYR